ncbi:hypothetical protein [Fodinibius roseus]|uniref:hypothetical protein n=1 Tax=Fodinibius roseus TaxID=1194090 RepID=UPI00111475C8|nr:hypothetical protein [Fodinibius roseus]
MIGLTGMLIGCGGNSSGTNPSKQTQKKVQLTGTLPQSLGVDSTFSDTLEFVNGKVGNVDLGDNKPEWLNIKTNENDKQVIIYGTTPGKTSTQKLTLNIQGDPTTSGNSAFGLSFTLSVFE